VKNLKTLMKNLPEEADGAIVTGYYNRCYLTGLQSSAGILLLTRNVARLIIDSRYYEAAKKTVPCETIMQQDNLHEQIAAFFSGHNVSEIALENDICTIETLHEYREKLSGFKFVETDLLSKQIWKLRKRKSLEEITLIGKAQNLTDQVFSQILDIVKPGMTEIELAFEIELIGRKEGRGEVAFSFIVAAGKNSSMPHAVPSNYVLQNGDMLTLDFGFKIDGYCSDMTRTVVIGEASEKQREVYGIVSRAQEAAFKKIRPGVLCNEVDSAARELIDATCYKGCFRHGLGHGIGLEVHENPRFNKICNEKLEPDMVLSVEQGIYIPGEFGVRIEDLVVVTENGYKNLTRSSKDFIVI
jgi:Xaa-Pro aminopeptidase